MKVAVPLFGEEVAPRFCFADRALVIDVQDGAIAGRSVQSLGPIGWPERLSMLADSGFDVLLCGGFPRRYEPFAQSVGIRVIAGLGGPADKLVESFINDDIERWMVAPPRGARRRRRGPPGQRGGRRNRGESGSQGGRR